MGLLSSLFGSERRRQDEALAQAVRSLQSLHNSEERNFRKSYGSRVLSGLSMPIHGYGMGVAWTDNRVEMTKQFRAWVYIAVNHICKIVAGMMPNVSRVQYDTAPQTTADQKGYRTKAFGPGHALYKEYKRRSHQRLYKKAMTNVAQNQDLEPVEDDHPLVALFRDPNPPSVSWTVWYELVMFLQLTGNSYLWLPENAFGVPAEMYCLPAHWIWPQAGDGGVVRSYHVRPILGSTTLITLPAEEVIHFAWPSPVSKIDGWSPLSAGARWLDVASSIDLARWSSFRNGAFPSFAMELDKDLLDPSPEQVVQIEQKFLSKFQGESRYGKPIVLSPGVSLVPLTINPTEMGYVDSAAQMRDYVLNLFGIPKTIIDPEATTYGALAAAQAAFFEITLKPIFTYLGQVLTEKLAHRFDPNLRVWWEDVVAEDPTELLQKRQAMFACGAYTPNEWRVEEGLPPLQHGGDNPCLANQEMPWGTGEVSQPPQPQPGQPGAPGAPGDPNAQPPAEGAAPAAEQGKTALPAAGSWQLVLPGDGAQQKDEAVRLSPVFNQPWNAQQTKEPPAAEPDVLSGKPRPDVAHWFKRSVNGNGNGHHNGKVKLPPLVEKSSSNGHAPKGAAAVAEPAQQAETPAPAPAASLLAVVKSLAGSANLVPVADLAAQCDISALAELLQTKQLLATGSPPVFVSLPIGTDAWGVAKAVDTLAREFAPAPAAPAPVAPQGKSSRAVRSLRRKVKQLEALVAKQAQTQTPPPASPPPAPAPTVTTRKRVERSPEGFVTAITEEVVPTPAQEDQRDASA